MQESGDPDLRELSRRFDFANYEYQELLQGFQLVKKGTHAILDSYSYLVNYMVRSNYFSGVYIIKEPVSSSAYSS